MQFELHIVGDRMKTLQLILNDEGKIDLFEVVKNEAISTGLSNALKVEQISDASYVNDGKMGCGLTYHSEALLKVTNTSDMTILIYENYDEQIVLKPGESTEISGKTTSACDASSDLPFTVQIEFYEYTGSDDPSDYINKTPTIKTIEITH